MAEQKFEDALKRLEEIVEELEKEDIELDRSLEIFEEAVGLSRYLNKKLDEAEKRIEILTREEGGELRAKPFISEEEAEEKEG